MVGDESRLDLARHFDERRRVEELPAAHVLFVQLREHLGCENERVFSCLSRQTDRQTFSSIPCRLPAR